MQKEGYDSLHEWWEPRHEIERLAPITIGRNAANSIRIFPVESQPNPTDQPAKLNDNPRALEPNDTHDG